LPTPQRRVAITGLGAIAAIGNTIPAFTANLFAGRPGIRPLAGLPLDRLTVRTAAQIQAFDPATHFDTKRLQQLDRVSQLALVAARQAWSDAAPTIPDPTRAGAILGAAIGLETFDAASHALYAENAKRLPPLTVPRIMPNAPASQVSIEFGLRGPSFAVASACASATHAIGLAFHMIRAGVLDLAMTGGSDSSFTLGFMKAWDALRILSPDTCRPFSRDRNGLVIGEGAGIVILEDFDRARARNAPIHAELIGFGMSADAADLLAPDAAGAASAMRAALTDASLEPAAIDHVNAHGTGTRLNDATEYAALLDVLGPRLHEIPVSATKSMTGHCLNAAGGIELIATILALRDGRVPPTINHAGSDPSCPLDCVPNEARTVRTNHALSNSFAFGGLNATLVVKRYE
jgi:nodulation protein E